MNKNILLTVGVNLQITVTKDSYLSLDKFREYVYRIMWVQGNIWVLNLCLIYRRIYGKNLTLWCIWLVELKKVKDWRMLKVQYEFNSQSLVLMEELSKWEISIDWILYWLCEKSDRIGKKIVVFQDLLNLLPGMGHIASSLLNPVLKI